jgi:signal transduction histidine kinase
MEHIRTILARQGIFFVLTVLGLIAINVAWLIPTLRNTRAAASVFSLTTAEHIQSKINDSLKSALNETTEVSEEVFEDPQRAVIIFRNLLRHHPIFTSITLVSRSGKELVRVDASESLPPEKFTDQSRNAWLYLALQGAPAFAPPVISANGEPHATLAVPVPKKGELFDQVIIARLNVQNLLSIIRSPNIGQGHAYVLDREGFQILHPDLAKILQHKNFSSRRIVQKVLGNDAIADGLAPDDQYINELGEDTFTVGMQIPVVKWGVFIERPRSEALAGERETLAIAIGTSLLAIIIFLVIARSTIKLQELSEMQNQLLVENDLSAKMLVRRDMELTNANTRLLELDKTKSEFVSVAAHQLRTPLTALRWSYHALLEGDMGMLTEDQRKIMQDGLHTTLQMIALINDLLNVARIEDGRFGFTFAPQSLETIIAESLPRFEKIAHEKGISLTYQSAGEKLPLLSLDAEKIRIVFDNLLDNALKYTSPGGSVALRVTQEDSHVRVEVADTGIGIPRDQIHRVFSKFFRTSNAMLFQTSGNGLGLYVVKNIVEIHGGAITVESTEGKGTTLAFTLPIKTAS